MMLSNEKEVKKWLRNFAVIKKELELKIRFYRELADEFKMVPAFKKQCDTYKEEVKKQQVKFNRHMADMEKLFSHLDEGERLVMTARYISCVKWDYIEMHAFYSRRQAIRVHDGAIPKLVGCRVGE